MFGWFTKNREGYMGVPDKPVQPRQIILSKNEITRAVVEWVSRHRPDSIANGPVTVELRGRIRNGEHDFSATVTEIVE